MKKWILRNIAMLLSLVMLVTSTAQTTYGFVVAATEPLVNIFVPTQIYEENVLSVTGEKTLSGREWKIGDSFDFVLEQKTAEGTWKEIGRKTLEYAPEKPDFDKFDFGDIQAVFASAGIYELRLYEEKGSAEGMTYDDTVYGITVLAEESADGEVFITAAAVNGKEIVPNFGKFAVEALFQNTYSAPGSAKASIGVKKEFTAESSSHTLAGFEFVLKETTPGREAERTAYSDGEGLAGFDVYFDKAGRYTFELYESAGSEDGMTYDEKVYSFAVEAAEENGVLTAKTEGGEEPFVFTNSYEAPKDKIKTHINVSVEVKNDRVPPTELERFEFVIYGPGFVDGGEVIEMEPDGKVSVPFTFYEDDIGTYEFTVKQIIPEEESAERIEELYYDENTRVITIEVTKNEEGGLEVTARVDGEKAPEATAHFINRFPGTTEVSLPIKITKTVDNKSGAKVPEAAFEFEAADAPEGGNVLAKGSAVIKEGKLSAETTLELALGKEYIGSHTFYIREVNGGAEGWIYEEKTLSFTVKIRNDGNDEAPDLVLEELVFEGESTAEIKAEFVNIYEGPAAERVKVPLVIRKKVKNIGDAEMGPEEFEFLIEDLTARTESRVRTDGEGEFVTYLEFTEADAGKNFRYRVKEINDKKSGVTYDDSVYDITVSVINENGKIKTSFTVNGFASSKLEFVFKNTYEKGAGANSAVVPIVIEKSVLNTGEKEIGPSGFEFIIEQVTENGEKGYSKTKVTDVDGTAVFELVFERSDFGEVYEYTVKEIPGGIEGMEYDSTVYKVEVGVYPGGTNGIGTAVYVNGKEVTEAVLEFENKYEFKDEGNPETGVFDPMQGIITMIFSGALFVILVLTDKRIKITK